MKSRTEIVPIGEVAVVRSGFAFKSTDWTPTGVPVVKIANVKDGNLVMGDCSYVSSSTALKAADSNLRTGDILIAMTGYIGDVAMVRERDLPVMLNQRVGKFTVRDPDRLIPQFLFYMLRSKSIREELAGLGYGSAQANISPSLIQSVEVPLPPLPEQRAIAHVLGTLDDKIELNRRMNETLEEMARALFKSWFVDFDPVRAKMDGHWRRGESLPGLPADLYDLFPDRLVPSELGEIPEGWEVGNVGDAATIVGGTTPSTKALEYWDGGSHFWATPKDLSNLAVPVLLATERRITDAGLQRIGSGLQPPGTLLMSSRAPIGYLAITEVPVAVNQGFIAMQPREGIPSLFLLYWCEAFMDEIVNHANGSTFLEISKSNFRMLPILRPSVPVLSAYHTLASALHDRIVVKEGTSRILTLQRDTLLPQLVSGEVGIV